MCSRGSPWQQRAENGGSNQLNSKLLHLPRMAQSGITRTQACKKNKLLVEQTWMLGQLWWLWRFSSGPLTLLPFSLHMSEFGKKKLLPKLPQLSVALAWKAWWRTTSTLASVGWVERKVSFLPQRIRSHKTAVKLCHLSTQRRE